MVGELTKILGFTGSATMIVALILGLFWKGDDAFNPAFRKKLSTSIRHLSIKDHTTNWPDVFSRIFDSIFGNKHFSFKCFFRSAAISFIIFVLLNILLLYTTYGVGYLYILSGFKVIYALADHETPNIQYYLAAVAIISVPVVVNILCDYVSLLQTRYFINISRKYYLSKGRLLLIAFLDICVSIAIYMITISCTIFVFVFLVFNQIVPNHDHVSNSIYFTNIIAWWNGDVTLNSMFYTTLFTSIWIFLFIIGLLVLKFFYLFSPVLTIYKDALWIEQFPVRSIGVAASSLAAVLFTLLAIIQIPF